MNVLSSWGRAVSSCGNISDERTENISLPAGKVTALSSLLAKSLPACMGNSLSSPKTTDLSYFPSLSYTCPIKQRIDMVNKYRKISYDLAFISAAQSTFEWLWTQVSGSVGLMGWFGGFGDGGEKGRNDSMLADTWWAGYGDSGSLQQGLN